MANSMSRHDFLRLVATGAAGCASLGLVGAGARKAAAQGATASGKRRPNILFFAVDDLRPELGCYGAKHIKSPNLDRLASMGLVFKRAYCQQAVCSPSRTSLMTGARPDTTKVYDLETHFRKTIPDVVTLPQHLMNNGYYCHGMGKIYHGSLNDPKSWSVPWEANPKSPEPVVESVNGYFSEEGKKIARENSAIASARKKAQIEKQGKALSPSQAKALRVRGLPYDMADVPDDQYSDGALALRAVEALNDIKKNKPDQPFFLAVGFHKPHLPFISPKKYWDLYPPETITLADNPFAPKGAPDYAGSSWGELRGYATMPKSGPVSDEQARILRRAYYAAVSFTDAQIGRVIDAVDRLGLRDNTIVIIWGDHGWKLGDHGMWCKHTNYEIDANAPLIISVPGQKTAGQQSDALVEFVDIYPSLCELCGLDLPKHLEGLSFAPVIEKPDRPWKKAAISQYPRSAPDKGKLMGYALATDRYRFVEWLPVGKDPGAVEGEIELYDHKTDPQENENVANRPENAKIVAEYRRLLRGGWRACLPPSV